MPFVTRKQEFLPIPSPSCAHNTPIESTNHHIMNASSNCSGAQTRNGNGRIAQSARLSKPCPPSIVTVSDQPGRSRNKKSPSFMDFFTLKEPSTAALRDYAQQEQKRLSTSKTALGSSRAVPKQLPAHVPSVNSKWDGLPGCAKTRHAWDRDHRIVSKQSSRALSLDTTPSPGASTARSVNSRLSTQTQQEVSFCRSSAPSASQDSSKLHKSSNATRSTEQAESARPDSRFESSTTSEMSSHNKSSGEGSHASPDFLSSSLIFQPTQHSQNRAQYGTRTKVANAPRPSDQSIWPASSSDEVRLDRSNDADGLYPPVNSSASWQQRDGNSTSRMGDSKDFKLDRKSPEAFNTVMMMSKENFAAVPELKRADSALDAVMTRGVIAPEAQPQTCEHQYGSLPPILDCVVVGNFSHVSQFQSIAHSVCTSTSASGKYLGQSYQEVQTRPHEETSQDGHTVEQSGIEDFGMLIDISSLVPFETDESSSIASSITIDPATNTFPQIEVDSVASTTTLPSTFKMTPKERLGLGGRLKKDYDAPWENFDHFLGSAEEPGHFKGAVEKNKFKRLSLKLKRM